MRGRLRLALLGAALVFATTAGAVAWAYEMWKVRSVAETDRLKLPAYSANALRHSLAAADTYAVIRLFGVPTGQAAHLVDRLGQLNEYKEFYFRPRRRRDPTREIYKDLYNNAVGILAAARLEEAGRDTTSDRLAFLGDLTARGIVMHLFTDARVPDFPDGSRPESSDLAAALDAFERDRSTAHRTIAAALAGG